MPARSNPSGAVILFHPMRSWTVIYHLPRWPGFKTRCGRSYLEPTYRLSDGAVRLRWDQADVLGRLCLICEPSTEAQP